MAEMPIAGFVFNSLYYKLEYRSLKLMIKELECMLRRKKTEEVFGISNSILNDSYINRGNLDEKIGRLLSRKSHIALRGESKCGKSWFRQKNIPNALVVQCRFGKTVLDIYIDALSQLGIKFVAEERNSYNLKGRIEAETSIGSSILSKIGFKSTVEASKDSEVKKNPVGQDINDLRYIADILVASERKLVIEDFHYLSKNERKNFAFDLKTLWDYGCFVVIIGVWSQSNLLSCINPDISGRIVEIPIDWSNVDLNGVVSKGSAALKLKFSEEIRTLLVDNCFGNVGILQNLILLLLDELEIYEEQKFVVDISDIKSYTNAAQGFANQLNAFYQQFAKRVSSGIRKRKDSTGIYAHAMAVIVDAEDDKLLNGLTLDEVFEIANNRQPRIQRGNLRTILGKLEELQVDEDGRGLVIAFDNSNDEITAVDRQLLFYRKYLTVKWPWENLIEELTSDS